MNKILQCQELIHYLWLREKEKKEKLSLLLLLDFLEEKDKKNGENKKDKEDSKMEMNKTETTLLVAAKNGILEMVEKILEDIPVAIHDTTSENKNILLVAVENRQPYVIKALRKNPLWDSLVLGMDGEENTVMHLAAKSSTYMVWQIPGAAMNMLWDIKWYQV